MTTVWTVIDATDAAELFEIADGEVVNGWERLGEQEEGSDRWQDNHTLVIRRVEDKGEYPGIYYGIAYSYGLTEYQEHEFPWRPGNPAYAGDQIPLIRLYRHRVVQTVYRRFPGAPPASPVDASGDRVAVVDHDLLARLKDAE